MRQLLHVRMLSYCKLSISSTALLIQHSDAHTCYSLIIELCVLLNYPHAASDLDPAWHTHLSTGFTPKRGALGLFPREVSWNYRNFLRLADVVRDSMV